MLWTGTPSKTRNWFTRNTIRSAKPRRVTPRLRPITICRTSQPHSVWAGGAPFGFWLIKGADFDFLIFPSIRSGYNKPKSSRTRFLICRESSCDCSAVKNSSPQGTHRYIPAFSTATCTLCGRCGKALRGIDHRPLATQPRNSSPEVGCTGTPLRLSDLLNAPAPVPWLWNSPPAAPPPEGSFRGSTRVRCRS